MDKLLSIQTIKNVFAALGAKTSDDNYGVALLDKTTAEPKGLMGMSDLVSFLGGQGKLFPYVGGVWLTNGNSGVEQLDSSLSDGFYSVTGYNSDSVVLDDGMLLVFGGMRVKFGKTIGRMALRGSSDTEWHLYTT